MEDYNSENSDSVMTSMTAKKKMYIFAFPRLGSTILLGIVGFALFFLYTDGFKLEERKVSTALSLGYIAIAASQFLIGWVSDKYYTRWGRRKPYIVILAPVLAISFIFLLMPNLILKNPSKEVLYSWLLVWDILFQISYGFTTAYQSWMAEQFTIEERPECSQIQNTFNYIGHGVMAIFTLVVLTDFKSKIEEDPNVIPPEFFLVCIVFAIILVGGYYLGAFLMPTEEPPKKNPKLWPNLKAILTNWNYLKVVIMQGLASFAWIIITTVMLSYTSIVMGFDTIQYLISAVALLFGILIALYFWRKLIKRYGKKNTLLKLFLYAAVISLSSLIGLISINNKILSTIVGTLFLIGIASFMGGWFLFPYIMYADLAEDDEKRTDELKAGIYIGFPSIILNLFQALGTRILGEITSMPDINVGLQSFSIGYVIWGPICAIILIITYFYSKYFVKLDFNW